GSTSARCSGFCCARFQKPNSDIVFLVGRAGRPRPAALHFRKTRWLTHVSFASQPPTRAKPPCEGGGAPVTQVCMKRGGLGALALLVVLALPSAPETKTTLPDLPLTPPLLEAEAVYPSPL